MVVPEERAAGDVERTIRDAAAAAGTVVATGEGESQASRATLAGVRLFDVYRGSPLGAAEKSLAFRLTITAGDADPEAGVDGLVAVIDDALVASGARLRA